MDSSLQNTSLPIPIGHNPPPDVHPKGPEITTDQNTSNDISGGDSVIPIKRRPGRPKGSGKKSLDLPPSTTVPKIKRPVGRPRKDGFPAGSVGPRRSARPRKSAPAKLGSEADTATNPNAVQFNGVRLMSYLPWSRLTDQAFQQVYYAYSSGAQHQWQGGSASTSIPSARARIATAPVAIDPTLDHENWAELARAKPTAFLATLLSTLYAPNPTSSAGPSVEEAFKSHLVSLAPKSDQSKGSQPIPSLYSILKTFWLPSSPAYFSLTASASTPRTPSEHRFLYWDPQPLVFNGIACPSCSVPLINKGRIRSGPIKIYDLENPFFIIGCEYVCKSTACVANTSSEGRKFASTDWAILRSLPARLKDEFPAHLLQGDPFVGCGANVWNWQALGVSRSLWNMVRGCLKVGLGRDAIFQVVRAIQGGVSDDREEAEEEGEEEEEEEEEEIHTSAVPREEIDAHMRIANSALSDKPDVSAMPTHDNLKLTCDEDYCGRLQQRLESQYRRCKCFPRSTRRTQHLCTQRSGCGSGTHDSILWTFPGWPLPQLALRLLHILPATSIRAAFRYL